MMYCYYQSGAATATTDLGIIQMPAYYHGCVPLASWRSNAEITVGQLCVLDKVHHPATMDHHGESRMKKLARVRQSGCPAPVTPDCFKPTGDKIGTV